MRALRFLAGPEAMARLRRDGASDALFGTVAGASGGPKWLALTRLDRAILSRWFKGRVQPLAMVGSSIGSWRFAAMARQDPAAVLRRFEEAYLAYVPSDTTMRTLTRESRAFLDIILGSPAGGDEGGRKGAGEILAHPCMRLSVLAVRGRGVLGARHPAWLAAGIGAAGLANLVSRRSLPLFFQRTLFADPRGADPFDLAAGFPTRRVPLTPANLGDVLMASGAIPFLLELVRDIGGAGPGAYMDGGIMDYHLDIPFTPGPSVPEAPGGDLVLFPHFGPKVVPGWFDKALAWRRPAAASLARTLLLCPSVEFLAGLPHGKIPDRRDFRALPPAERQRYWCQAVAETDRLADEFLDAVDRDRIPDLLEPIRC
ncbi:patatin-like phospholipase family protein [Azospirillum sp. B4]|uniref:patatin-like phospholipase family protein n=1 Tax=Azospirillum sp. B4 TaxID=95605 RepID=UPI0011DCB231|nr:patatin-like phospholipase family protein [Azospirillum sp. B4]